jgi:MFS family permease
MADKVTLKENAKNNSIFAFFAGISYAIGPAIGGFLTDSNWRWCFGINLPVAAIGVVLVFVVLRPQLLGPQPLPELLTQDGEQGRSQKLKAQLSTIDFGGQILFLFGLGLLVLSLTWGGGKYPWHDSHVVAPLVIGSALSIGFVVWQYLMAPGRYLSRKLPVQRPTLPWKLLAQRNMYLLFYINFATGMGM